MKSYLQKALILVLLMTILCSTSPAPARAGYWGEDLLAVTYKEMLEEVYIQIKETLISNLKMVAIRTIQSRLSSLLGSSGSDGGSVIISNWQNFVYSSASQYSTKMTSDFFKGLESNLPSAVKQNITSPAKIATLSDPFSMKPDIQNYITNGDMSQVFTPGATQNMWGTWRQGAKTQNDPATYAILGESLKQESFRQKEALKTTELQVGKGYQNVTKESSSKTTSPPTSGGLTAYSKDGKPYTVPPGSGGYTAYSKDGKPYTVPSSAASSSDFGEDPLAGTSVDEIMTPGSDVQAMQSKVKSMPIDMLAMARSVPEIATSMVTSILTQMMNQGISMVTNKISGQLGNSGQVGSMLSGAVSGLSGTASNIGGKVINTSTGKLQNMIQSGLK